jgi:anti-sigma-K factor RskA
VVWNLQRRRAVLLASGLQPAPPGKRYEVWVIAGGAPVPSGLFQADARGSAVAELPWQEQTAAVRTFAVTLEPEAGTPAPTGPMVLAGNVAG